MTPASRRRRMRRWLEGQQARLLHQVQEFSVDAIENELLRHRGTP